LVINALVMVKYHPEAIHHSVQIIYNTRGAENEKSMMVLIMSIMHVRINNFLYPYLSARLPNTYEQSIHTIRNIIRITDFIVSFTLYKTSITTARYSNIVSTISEMSENANKYSQTFFCVVRSCLIQVRVFL